MPTPHPPELNEEVLQELLDIPNLQIKRAHVSRVVVWIPYTRLKVEPVVLHVDHMELVVEEP